MQLGGWSIGAVLVLVGSTMCQSPEHEAGAPSRAGAGGKGGRGGTAGADGGGGSPAGEGGAPEAGMGGIGGSSDSGAGGAGGEMPPPDPPTISREGSIPAPAAVDGPPRSGRELALAYGDGTYLVVWDDASGAGTTIDVLGARYSETGMLLDEQPIVIAGSAGDEEFPAVAFDGTNFLITWTAFRGPFRAGNVDILGARLPPVGRLLDREPIMVLRDGFLHSSAPGSSGWLVAAGGDPTGLRLIEIDGSGLVGEERELVSMSDVFDPKLASGNASSLVLLSNDDTPSGSRLNALLVQEDVSEPLVTDFGRRQRYSPVAWGGDAYYFTWQDASYALSLERIDEDGVRSSLALPDIEDIGGIAASATEVAVTYNAYEAGMYAGRVRPFATTSLAPGTDLELSAFDENLWVGSAARGSSTFAVLHGSRLITAVEGPGLTILNDSASAVVRRTDPLPSVGVSQREPAVAADASGFTLAWSEVSAQPNTVRLVRFDASGELLDAEPIELGTGMNPAVARRNGETLVAWSSDGSLLVSRIDAEGDVTDTETIAEYRPVPGEGSYSYYSPRVAATEDGFVTSFYEYPLRQANPHVVAVGLFGATAPSSPGSMPRTTEYGSTSALAGIQGGFALAYTGTYEQASGLVLELTTGGTVRSMVVEEGSPVSPSLASAGDRVLVVWESNTVEPDRDQRALRAAVIDVADGVPVGAILELASPGEFALGPSAAFDGERFIVTWAEQAPEGSYDFVGARIETDGRLYDPVPFSLPVLERRRRAPTLAAGPDAVLCAYTRLVEPSAASSIKLLWLGR